MRTSTVGSFVLIALALGGVPGCDYQPPVPPGGRVWVLEVVNRSARPATLVVAEDEATMGDTVGTATPSVVPPGATVLVTFGVPPGEAWAIFVNPRPDMGPLLTPGDLPLADGIEIALDGSPGWIDTP
jgi:hypothetical protein